MSGAITITSVSNKVSYARGTMEYVYDFLEVPEQTVAQRYGPGPYTTVTPNTYKIDLFSKKATY